MTNTQHTETPEAFVRAVERYFDITFDWDLAANRQNTKAPRWIDESEDSLRTIWTALHGWSWLNPPFKNLTAWVNKCAVEENKIVSIWPLSGDLNQIPTWTKARVYIVHGRVWPQVRGCMLCLWTDRLGPNMIRGLSWDRKRGKLTRLY